MHPGSAEICRKHSCEGALASDSYPRGNKMKENANIRFKGQVDEGLDTSYGQEGRRPPAFDERKVESACASAASSTSCFGVLVEARVLSIRWLSVGGLGERCLGIGLAVFRAIVAALAKGAVVILSAILVEGRVASVAAAQQGVLSVHCGCHDEYCATPTGSLREATKE